MTRNLWEYHWWISVCKRCFTFTKSELGKQWSDKKPDHFFGLAQTAIYQSPMEILISVFASEAKWVKGIKLTGRLHNQIFSISYFTDIIR